METNELEMNSVKPADELEAIKNEALEEKNDENPNSNADLESKNNAFDIIAWVSFFVGLATLIISFVGYGLFFFWIGIIISCVGKKSIKNRKKADYGLLFSIFALVMTISLFIFAN